MQKLNFVCKNCSKEFILSLGTTKSGVDNLVKEYGEDARLDILRKKDGEEANSFSDKIARRHELPNSEEIYSGEICFKSLSYLD